MEFVQNLDPSKLTVGLTVGGLSLSNCSYEQVAGSFLSYFALHGATLQPPNHAFWYLGRATTGELRRSGLANSTLVVSPITLC